VLECEVNECMMTPPVWLLISKQWQDGMDVLVNRYIKVVHELEERIAGWERENRREIFCEGIIYLSKSDSGHIKRRTKERVSERMGGDEICGRNRRGVGI
jgi:hypothetical protein